jgi:hypothetical protein
VSSPPSNSVSESALEEVKVIRFINDANRARNNTSHSPPQLGRLSHTHGLNNITESSSLLHPSSLLHHVLQFHLSFLVLTFDLLFCCLSSLSDSQFHTLSLSKESF